MGELARKPGCPELPATPLELLTPRPGEGFNLVDRLVSPVGCTITGVSMVLIRNLVRKRPLWSGIQLHIIAGAVGCYIGLTVQKSKFAARAERDAVLKHYITLHPEDFPPYEIKRFGEVYYPFKPIR